MMRCAALGFVLMHFVGVRLGRFVEACCAAVWFALLRQEGRVLVGLLRCGLEVWVWQGRYGVLSSDKSRLAMLR
jgi:hypothetical protein